MTQKIDLFDAIGKTISGVAIGNCDQTCLILFDDDDTFATVDATGGGDSCYFELSTKEIFDPLEFSDAKLALLGIYSSKELDSMRQQRRAEYRAQSEERERKLFESLQKKYGTV